MASYTYVYSFFSIGSMVLFDENTLFIHASSSFASIAVNLPVYLLIATSLHFGNIKIGQKYSFILIDPPLSINRAILSLLFHH